jgi:hypothetical protein
MGALLWSSHTVQNSCITPHRGYEFVKVLKERRDHPVLPNDPIHPINRRGRKNFCKEERKFKENPKSIYRMFELTSTIYCVRIAM